MIKWAFVFLIIAAATLQSVHSKSLPSYLKACKRKDPNFDKCLQTFVDTILKKAAKGVPELKIPALEPFVIPEIVLDQGSSKAVTLKSTMKKVAVYGLTTTNLNKAKAILEPAPYFEIDFAMPTIRLESDYNMEGKLLVVPIKGSGKMTSNLTEASGVAKITTEIVDKKGSAYLKVVKREVEVDVKHAQFHFDNLFNGNKELGDTTNKFINENWQELYKELRPVIAEAIGFIVQHVVQIVLNEYSYNEIFPEN